jgi:hypothetical protein
MVGAKDWLCTGLSALISCTERDVDLQPGSLLEIAEHTEQILSLRIAARPEHAD